MSKTEDHWRNCPVVERDPERLSGADEGEASGKVATVTLKERRARALKERRAALDRLLPRLAEEAARFRGRYVLFGSAARGEFRANSDVDLLADFPSERVPAAVRAAERACAELDFECDIIERRSCSRAFLIRILPQSRVIP